MGEASGGGAKRKITLDNVEDCSTPKMSQKFSRSKRGLFKDYNHIYSDDRKDYPILVTSDDTDIITLGKLLKEIKGIDHVRQVGPVLFKVQFLNKSDANSFLLDTLFLERHKLKAKIPFDKIEAQGIIQVPSHITEEELLTELKSSCDIIGVKRFQKKKADGFYSPLPTVLITFLSSSRPDHVTYDYIWFSVKEYVKPLLQCYKCYKFGHGSGSCKSQQVCSICSGSHFFKVCDNPNNIRCVNCSGEHIAISFSCPVKSRKIAEIKNRINGKSTYASVTTSNTLPPSNTVPASSSLKTPSNRVLITDILNSELVLKGLVKTVMSIIKISQNDKQTQKFTGPLSSEKIKEMLISNLTG